MAFLCFALRLVAELVPTSQPIRIKSKTNRDFAPHIFPRKSAGDTSVVHSNSDWFIALLMSVVIGWRNCFGFGFTTHNTKCVQQSSNKKAKRYCRFVNLLHSSPPCQRFQTVLSLSMGTHGLRFLRDFFANLRFFRKIFVFRIEMV